MFTERIIVKNVFIVFAGLTLSDPFCCQIVVYITE